MKLKNLLKLIVHYISVPKCVCCEEKLGYGKGALCDSCLEIYREIKTRDCSLCSKPLYRCSCSNSYLEAHYVKKLIKVYRYLPELSLPTNRLIYSLKRDDRDDVLDFARRELSAAIKNSVENPSEYIFTYVPRRRKSVVKYGIDHAQLLSKALAKEFSAEFYPLLISKSKSPQKSTAGEERLKNAKFKYKKNSPNLSGKKVILVDDIVTTGASLGTCAALIRGLGAKTIVGCVMAIAYKDPHTIPERGDRFS